MSASTARSSRSSNGCLTCRARHKKCPGPQGNTSGCSECDKLNIECLGYRQHRFFWMRDPRILKHFTNDIKKWTSKKSNMNLPRRLTFEHYLNLPRDPPSSSDLFTPSPSSSASTLSSSSLHPPLYNVPHSPPSHENNLDYIIRESEFDSVVASTLPYWKQLFGEDIFAPQGTKFTENGGE